MKNISSTTENFIREQIALKFKKQLDALKKKKIDLDEKRHGISEQIDKLIGQLSNARKLSGEQANAVQSLQEDIADIVRKACEKTVAARLKPIGLKIANAESAFEHIIDWGGIFNAIDCEYIVNVRNDADKIKKRGQELADRREKISEECNKADAEIDELNRKIDAHAKTIVVMLELGGNYDDLMKMINEIKT